MRAFLTSVIVAAVVLLLGVGYAGPPRLLLYRRHATLTATPLAAPAPPMTGRLTWLGGVRLTSNDLAAGGYSALAVRRITGRQHVLLLSDGGNLTGFTLGDDWRVRDGQTKALPDGPRTGWEKRDRDSESLAFDERGRAWVGFESVNALWRYSPGFARATGSVRPHPMWRWGANGGPESMVRLRNGRFVVLAETAHWPGAPGRAGIMFAGDPVAAPDRLFGFHYIPAPGFDPADAAELPNGDLIVLERRWLFAFRFRSRLVRVPRAALRPGAVVAGAELGRIPASWPTENYEGVAVAREGGRTIIWLVSDDDQEWWRASYLLKLRLD